MDSQGKQIIGIIPARFGSTRLPGKPLKDICGKPLLQRVWESACKSETLLRVVIATDDKRIEDLCFDMGAECVMTSSDLPSGTDRIMAAYLKLGETADIVVNIQGDEPLLTSELIDNLISKFIKSQSSVGTLISRIKTLEDIENMSVVKVGLNSDMTARNFSRLPIPYLNDIPKHKWLDSAEFYKHIGIYVYKIESLKTFVSLPVSKSEKIEKLEQLRLMEDGASYYCMETNAELIGIDTPEDLIQIKEYF